MPVGADGSANGLGSFRFCFRLPGFPLSSLIFDGLLMFGIGYLARCVRARGGGFVMLREIVIGLIVVIGGSLIALFTSRYRNKIVYDKHIIRSDVFMHGELFSIDRITSHRQTLNFVMIEFKNVGWLDLQNVELHLETVAPAKNIEISDTKSLSVQSVSTVVEEKLLKIIVPHFPAKETFTLKFANLGWSERVSSKPRGTGGRYKMRSHDRHEAYGQVLNFISWCFALAAGWAVWSTG